MFASCRPSKRFEIWFAARKSPLGSHARQMWLTQPLFVASDRADGALSESLGMFYSQALNEHPKKFVAALAVVSRQSQARVCESASFEDGGGMSDETFKAVKRSLNALGRQDNRLAVVARRCAIVLQRGKTQADANRKALML